MFDFFFRKTKANNGKVLNKDLIETTDIHLTEGKGESNGIVLISPKGGVYIPNTLPNREEHIKIHKQVIETDQKSNEIHNNSAITIEKLVETVVDLAQTLQQATKDPVAGQGAPWGSPTINGKIPSIVAKLNTIKSSDIKKIKDNTKKTNDAFKENDKSLNELTEKLV